MALDSKCVVALIDENGINVVPVPPHSPVCRQFVGDKMTMMCPACEYHLFAEGIKDFIVYTIANGDEPKEARRAKPR